MAPPTSSSFSSSFSPAEAVQGREGGAISEEATAASHGSSSSSSSSSSNSNDTLGARCAWCWRAYRSWLSGVVGLLGDLEVGSNSEHIGVVVVNRTANMSVDKDIGAVFLGYSPFLLNYFLCISFKSVSPPPVFALLVGLFGRRTRPRPRHAPPPNAQPRGECMHDFDTRVCLMISVVCTCHCLPYLPVLIGMFHTCE